MFIDYEYADFNYTLFDIANHFCEFAGVENPDYKQCPDRDEMRVFLCFYLEARHGHVDKNRLTAMLRRISLFQAVRRNILSSQFKSLASYLTYLEHYVEI
ncbi:unnamed protein product [Strongylus vulgaris]|uniref:ethanolamine kinase n=1 Tax=Strongylus vulgaris TaxID=40348 RepID=A0A3P7IXQ4_STRVU|nr:unnamed protein product [Strongylus vulgaris]